MAKSKERDVLRNQYHKDRMTFQMLSFGLSGVLKNTCDLYIEDLPSIRLAFESWESALHTVCDSRDAYYGSRTRRRIRRSVLKPRKKAVKKQKEQSS